jgi:plastocyanin
MTSLKYRQGGKRMEHKVKTSQGNNLTLEVTVQDLAFSLRSLKAPRSTQVILIMHNLDPGIAHNFSLYENSQRSRVIFKGEIITGPGDIKYAFTTPAEPGTYFFCCDIHPMAKTSGDFIIDETT